MSLARPPCGAVFPSLILAAVLTTGAVAAPTRVYRCPQLNGHLSFQDRPCQGGSELEARPLPRLGGSLIGLETPEGAARRSMLLGARQGREPAIGMSEAELEQVLGQAKRIHARNRGRGREVQRIYERQGRVYLVDIREGQVTAIRNRQGGETRRTRHCPSALEIRNAETGASSLTIDLKERQQLRKQVQRMRECR